MNAFNERFSVHKANLDFISLLHISIQNLFMKKLFSFIFVLIAFQAVAQETIYLDYPEADRISHGFLTKNSASTELNSNYDTLDIVVNPTKFAGVRLLNLNGFYENRAAFAYYDVDQLVEGPVSVNGIKMKVDTLFALLGHENVSGLPDTIIFNVHQLNSAGNFSDSEPLLWTDSVFTDTSITGGYLTVTTFTIPVGIDVPPGKKAGISVGYRGDKRDKFGIGLSFVRSPATNKILRSDYPYSVLKLAGFRNENYTDMAFINTGVDTVTGDTNFFEFQNWYMWASVTYQPDGIEEQARIPFEVNQNLPNPFSENTTVKYSLFNPQQVSLAIYSLNGELIENRPLGFKYPGEYQTDISSSGLASGIYFYRLEGSKSTSPMQKMIIAK